MSPVISRTWVSGIFSTFLAMASRNSPWPLEAAMQRVAAMASVVLSGHATGFNRIGGHTIDDEPLLDHVRGAGEGGFDRGFVAGFIEIGFVLGAVVVELRRPGSNASRADTTAGRTS
jgi:hypothetical protein